jgi:hypothetical protein
MGFLNLFSRSDAAVQRLPSGSLTVDANGRIVATTVSSSYPEELLQEIANEVLALFREARAAQMPMLEVNIHFASLLVSAREMRGGAIIFLSPRIKSFTSPSSSSN